MVASTLQAPTRGWFDVLDDWLKLKPFKLNAIVQIPIEVNHTQTTGNTARKKCKLLELLKDAYWKISLPKYP